VRLVGPKASAERKRDRIAEFARQGFKTCHANYTGRGINTKFIFKHSVKYIYMFICVVYYALNNTTSYRLVM